MAKLKAVPWLKITDNARCRQHHHHGGYDRRSRTARPHCHRKDRGHPTGHHCRSWLSQRRSRPLPSFLRESNPLLTLFPSASASAVLPKVTPSLAYAKSPTTNTQFFKPSLTATLFPNPYPLQQPPPSTIAKNKQNPSTSANRHFQRTTQPNRLYAQVASPNLTPPSAPYHQSAWRFFMDLNPWTHHPNQIGSNDQPDLPLPPNPFHRLGKTDAICVWV